MKRSKLIALAFLAALPLEAAEKPAPDSGHQGPVLNRVRFFPAPGREKAMVGGKIAGSNLSATNGYKVLAKIDAVPKSGEWTELTFPNETLYRWIRYEGPPGSFGSVAEIEFEAGSQKLNGRRFGSDGERPPGGSWQRAVDGKTESWFQSDSPNDQYVGIDLREQATPQFVRMSPPPGDHKGPQHVTLGCPTPGTVIRYTLDGTTPGPGEGTLYSSPIAIDKTSTIVAVAFKEGQAPSPPASGIYLIDASAKTGLHTFHIGNSLTGTTQRFGLYARAAGRPHHYASFTAGGAWTNQLWDRELPKRKEQWKKLLDSYPRIDHFTVQPRDFNIAEEADYDVRFFNVIRKKSPEFQPWLYAEWVERARQRPTDKALVPSSQMKALYPALTWEESMAAMLLYIEELQHKLGEIDKEGKRPRVLPSAVAMGWIKNLIDNDRFPRARPGSFYPLLFDDSVHPNANGGYLVDLTWYAAFYRESPEGKVPPVETELSAEQARIMQRLAWDVVKNYPDCGLYEPGTTPVAKPEFLPAPAPIRAVTPVTLSSLSPGAWFRYTLDGSTPSRTNGYVYCGVVSVRPGMTVKAVAYESGMADSPVAEVTYPEFKNEGKTSE